MLRASLKKYNVVCIEGRQINDTCAQREKKNRSAKIKKQNARDIRTVFSINNMYNDTYIVMFFQNLFSRNVLFISSIKNYEERNKIK